MDYIAQQCNSTDLFQDLNKHVIDWLLRKQDNFLFKHLLYFFATGIFCWSIEYLLTC